MDNTFKGFFFIKALNVHIYTIRMKKYFLLVITIFLFTHSIFSQDLFITGTIGLNRGFQNNTLDFQGVDIRYSPGSGLKFEGGVEYISTSNFILYSKLAINFSYAMQYFAMNGQTAKTSYNFNWKTLSGGIGKYFPEEDIDFIEGYSLIGGLDYSVPGKASITENNTYYGEVYYYSSIGFHSNFRVHLQIKELYFMPSVGINIIGHSMKDFDYENGSPRADLMDPKSTGLSFALTIAKQLGAN